MNATHPTHHRTLWSAMVDVLGASPRERSVRITPTSGSGSWHWLYVDRNGVSVAGPRASFSSQDAAEAWVDANADGLKGLGITAITLRDGEHVVYGPTGV
jgi:hypothetical protein